MPELRQSPVRKKRMKSRLCNSTTSEEKLQAIRALYIMVFNSDESLIPLTTELFHALGSILEGVPPCELSLSRVDKSVFLETINTL